MTVPELSFLYRFPRSLFMAKVGRPGKLDPEVLKILCEDIEEGMPYKHAAPAAGISYHTIPTMMPNAYQYT